MKYILIALMMVSAPSYASPGAVNKQGCHSKPKHCHSASDIRKMKNGRRYVPFGQG